MFVLSDSEPFSQQLGSDRREFCRCHYHIGIKSEHRLDIAVNREPVNQHHGPCSFRIRTSKAKSLAPLPVTDSKTSVAVKFQFILSKIPAAPMPPPTHIVTIPYRPWRRPSSRKMVAVSFAPVQPSG